MRFSGPSWVVAGIVSLVVAAPVVPVSQGVVLELGEGQRALVSGTELAVGLIQVRNLTAQGCLGGPIGCRDSAELVVTRGRKSQRVVLYLPRNRSETEQGVNQARLFGHVIRLVALQGTRARLEVGAARGSVQFMSDLTFEPEKEAR